MLQFYIPEVKGVEQVSYLFDNNNNIHFCFLFRLKMMLIEHQRKNSKNSKKNFMMKKMFHRLNKLVFNIPNKSELVIRYKIKRDLYIVDF
jgi:hypothetical protein